MKNTITVNNSQKSFIAAEKAINMIIKTSKYSKEELTKMYLMKQNGLTYKQIALVFNISANAIREKLLKINHLATNFIKNN